LQEQEPVLTSLWEKHRIVVNQGIQSRVLRLVTTMNF